MIRFVDLNNNCIFDGSSPYVFWFNDQQSTDMIYTKSIGVLCDDEDGFFDDDGNHILNISMEENEIFRLLDISKINNDHIDQDIIKGFKYYDINDLYSYNIRSIGEYTNGYYFHIIYISSSSNDIGEYLHEFYIEEQPYKIGADFYNENESLYINLSNFGIEIPDSIQKAIYSSNIHEDMKDNILINRKFKELLSNYWDIIANKGSYKSLINSLNWFEPSDKIRLREIWKHDTDIKTIYGDRELMSLMKDKYSEYFNHFAKTTYIALYNTLEELKRDENNNVEYDDEYNPILKHISSKWSIKELALKMSMLGYFYKTYFMPIHLDLIHSTIEDITFTNTFKINKGTSLSRVDSIYNFESVLSNIKDDDVFTLGNVSVYVGPDTVFGTKWNGQKNYNDVKIIGVDEDVNNINNGVVDNNLKTFYSQLYKGVGVIIPISLTIQSKNDPIKKSIIHIKTDNDWNTLESYNIFVPDDNNNINIKFNLLCKEEGSYEYRFEFLSKGSKTFTKVLKFNVIDIENTCLKIKKIVKNERFSINDIKNIDMNEYIFKRQPFDKSKPNFYTQYLNPNGIGMNHFMVLKNYDDSILNDKDLNDQWYFFEKYDKEQGLKTQVRYPKSTNQYPKTIDDFEWAEFTMKKHYLTVGDLEADYPMIKGILSEDDFNDGGLYVWEINNQDIDLNKIVFSRKDYINDEAYIIDPLIYSTDKKSNKKRNLIKTLTRYTNYLYCISKKFQKDYNNYEPEGRILYNKANYLWKDYLYKNQYSFFPQFHYLEDLNGDKLENFIITDDTLCIIPDLKFGKHIDDYEWYLENVSTSDIIKLPEVCEPFTGNMENKQLKPGYYNIIFKYSLINGSTHEIKLNSAFVIKK